MENHLIRHGAPHRRTMFEGTCVVQRETKLKQMEMARRLGVDVSTIRRLERRAIGLLSATKVNLISPCLFMATRWRHRTTLSRRQDRLSIANLDMWRFQFHILL